jgi:hypothetical protein
MTNNLPEPQENWKPQVYLLGGLAGVIIGVLAAYFYARASEEISPRQPSRIKTMDALKLGVALLSLIRQITDLGADGHKK